VAAPALGTLAGQKVGTLAARSAVLRGQLWLEGWLAIAGHRDARALAGRAWAPWTTGRAGAQWLQLRHLVAARIGSTVRGNAALA